MEVRIEWQEREREERGDRGGDDQDREEREGWREGGWESKRERYKRKENA